MNGEQCSNPVLPSPERDDLYSAGQMREYANQVAIDAFMFILAILQQEGGTYRLTAQTLDTMLGGVAGKALTRQREPESGDLVLRVVDVARPAERPQ